MEKLDVTWIMDVWGENGVPLTNDRSATHTFDDHKKRFTIEFVPPKDQSYVTCILQIIKWEATKIKAQQS